MGGDQRRGGEVDLKVDSAAYGLSALLALTVGHTTQLSTFKMWAAWAAPAYLLAALVSAVMWERSRRGSGSGSTKLRLVVAAATLTAAVVLPLGQQVHARAETGARLAQSEVVVVEQAAADLVARRDPYTATFDERGLESRPFAQDHFAYLPLMLAFGLPRAFGGPVELSDARVSMALVTLLTLTVALCRWATTTSRRIRAVQFTLILPSGALFLTTGGDDLPVLALLFLGLVLLQRGDRGAWPVLAVAALLKQTAWPVLLVLLLSQLPARQARAQRARSGQPVFRILAVVPSLLAPFALWHPASFMDDVFLFPLGLASGPSPDQLPTLGSWFVGAPGVLHDRIGREVLMAGLLGAILVVGGVLIGHRSRFHQVGAADDARTAGLIMLALIAVCPVSRTGYLIYPLDLLLFSALLRQPPGVLAEQTSEPATGGARIPRPAPAIASVWRRLRGGVRNTGRVPAPEEVGYG